MARLQLSTESGCGLAIAGYPRFRYDARGGGGPAEEGEPEPQPDRQSEGDGGGGLWVPLRFAAEQLSIPTLNWRTTRLLGLPLPPGIAIAIVPERLQGHWRPDSGAVELAFRARFRFSLAGLYRAPDLLVATQLSSGEVVGRRHRASGSPLDGEGRGVLVGVARVEPSGDPLLDRFLGLPDEALAVLRCRLSRS
jgi:hypothetical protein